MRRKICFIRKFFRNFDKPVLHIFDGQPTQKFTLFTVILILGFTIPCHSQTPTPDQLQVISLFKQAEEYNSQQNYPAAINLYQQALQLAEHAFGLKDPNYITLRTNLATIYKNAGMFEKAEETYKQVAASWEKSAGPDDPNVAATLNLLSVVYYSQGKFTEARSILLRALAIRKKSFGIWHPDVAQTMNNLAAVYSAIGDYQTAENYCSNALDILERAHGENDPKIINALVNLTDIYLSLSKLKEGIAVGNRALALEEKYFGSSHPGVATILDKIGNLYFTLKDFEKAEVMCSRSLKIRETSLGPNHPETATSLNNLAALYESLNKDAEAEALMKRAMNIYVKNFGKTHPSYASALHNLGSLYSSMGEFSTAEELLLEAAALRKSIYGTEHDKVADTLNNLAGLYADMGDYDKAKSNYEEALRIRKIVFGNDHPLSAATMNNIAGIYSYLGDFKKALELYENALSIREKAFGPNHLDVAESYNNLASIYQSSGEYEKSLAYYNKSLVIVENNLGKDSLLASKILNNIAEVHLADGKPSTALPLYEQGLSILEKKLGKKHLNVATFYNNMGGCRLALGDFEIANSYYRKALAIRIEILSSNHPSLSVNYFNIAAACAGMGKNKEALLSMKKGIGIEKALIDQAMGFSSDRQKQLFLKEKQWHLYSLFTIASKYFGDNNNEISYLYDIWAQRKGIILEAQKRFKQALIYSDNKEALQLSQDLSQVRTNLSRLTFADTGKYDLDYINNRIKQLRKEKEDLEIKLSEISQIYSKNKQISISNTKTISEALPAGKVLIDFARITPIDFRARGTDAKWLPERYFVFILKSGKDSHVEIVDLGEAEPIDNNVAEFKKKIIAEMGTNSNLYSKHSQQIYSLVFKPIEEKIGKAKDIFLSPDGNLNLIPFEVLQRPDGRYLIEDFTFNYLAVGRDIVGFSDISTPNSKALLFGDPDFDMILDGEHNKTIPRKEIQAVDKAKVFTDRSADMRGMKFSRLPNTKDEVQQIQKLLGEETCTIYTGKAALESRLSQTESPSLLHLATHGFFLNDFDLRSLTSFGAKKNYPNKGNQLLNNINARIENPLLRSGIVLSGANHALQANDIGKSDGIITAEKILNLKLSGTKMVVLSACETGLGDVQKGEGVYGLRRAFLHAGAKSLVMSMWSVPDRETKEQMIAFYHNLTKENMNRCKALRQATLRQLKIVKERYGHTNPIYWGAFVFLGEP